MSVRNDVTLVFPNALAQKNWLVKHFWAKSITNFSNKITMMGARNEKYGSELIKSVVNFENALLRK